MAATGSVPFNFDPEVQAQFDWPKPFLLIDSTLRKTLFTAGALTSMDGFVRIAEALAEAGVKQESLNINWAGGIHRSRVSLHSAERSPAVISDSS